MRMLVLQNGRYRASNSLRRRRPSTSSSCCRILWSAPHPHINNSHPILPPHHWTSIPVASQMTNQTPLESCASGAQQTGCRFASMHEGLSANFHCHAQSYKEKNGIWTLRQLHHPHKHPIVSTNKPCTCPEYSQYEKKSNRLALMFKCTPPT